VCGEKKEGKQIKIREKFEAFFLLLNIAIKYIIINDRWGIAVVEGFWAVYHPEHSQCCFKLNSNIVCLPKKSNFCFLNFFSVLAAVSRKKTRGRRLSRRRHRVSCCCHVMSGSRRQLIQPIHHH